MHVEKQKRQIEEILNGSASHSGLQNPSETGGPVDDYEGLR
jgi:hypothetical protein